MYKKISVREQVYARLVELQKNLGLTSISDVIALLLDHYDISSKLDRLLAEFPSERGNQLKNTST